MEEAILTEVQLFRIGALKMPRMEQPQCTGYCENNAVRFFESGHVPFLSVSFLPVPILLVPFLPATFFLLPFLPAPFLPVSFLSLSFFLDSSDVGCYDT